MSATDHNTELLNELIEMIKQNQSGLIMDIEVLQKAKEVGDNAIMPQEHEIDPSTGLSHRVEYKL